jgi:hypothetical protein
MQGRHPVPFRSHCLYKLGTTEQYVQPYQGEVTGSNMREKKGEVGVL